MATTTETVNKTTVVEVVKEADVVNRQEVKGTTDIVFIVDKSGSMDSHITDVANNIEKFVRDLESKNVQARLGLVDYESSKNTTYRNRTTFKTSISRDFRISLIFSLCKMVPKIWSTLENFKIT